MFFRNIYIFSNTFQIAWRIMILSFKHILHIKIVSQIYKRCIPLKQSRTCINECFCIWCVDFKSRKLVWCEKDAHFWNFTYTCIFRIITQVLVLLILLLCYFQYKSAFSEVYVFHAYVLRVCPYVMYGSPILKIHKTIPRHEPIPINI